jgi:LacI family transcriptional regulator
MTPQPPHRDPAPGSASAADPPPVEGRERPGKRVSMRDVADRAGVSVATVSMVLNKSERISRATHLKVQQVIDKLGYRPNRLAQSLSGAYTRVLAILLPPLRHVFSDPYFGELISGICDRADRFSQKVILEQSKPAFLREKRHLELFERRFIDGLLCLGLNDEHEFLKDFADRPYPVMIVDNRFKDAPLDYVVCDYRNGAEQAMNYLLQLGHRRIGMIHGAMASPTARDVVAVYEQRLREAGVDVPDDWKVDGRYTEQGGAEAAARICAAEPRITAIFAGNDKMALGAMHYLAGRGVRVPDDVSVMGFDDIQHTAYVNPSLTTVHLPLYEVGERACDRLIQRIRNKQTSVAEKLPTHVVLRESTAMAPAARPSV